MGRTLLAITVLVLPLAASGAQDEGKIKDLIQKLDDDSFDTREQAEKDLTALGDAALPLLKKAAQDAEQRKDRGELRVRALSAIRAIEFAAKAKKVYTEPALVTLTLREAGLAQVLEEITKQTTVHFHLSEIDARQTVSIDVKNAPLFKVLDVICQGQTERSFEWKDESVRFTKEKHVAYPSAYEGPFRLRVVRLKQERSTDFKVKTSHVQLSIDADWQRYLNPSKRYEIEIKKAVDDKGGTLEVRKGEDMEDAVFAGGARIVMRRAVMVAGMAGSDAAGQAQPFTLKGLSSGASQISIEGVAKFTFPLEKTDVVFEKPGANETREAGDYSIGLRNLANGRLWWLTFSRAKGKTDGGSWEDVDARLDKDSFVAIDEDGNEQKGTLSPTNASFPVGGVENQPFATYQGMFAAKLRSVKELRFKFVGQALVKSVKFKIPNIELP